MNTKKGEIKKGEEELEVELSFQEFWPYVEKACRKISKSMNVPGFRPGQVPFSILEKKVGSEVIYQEAAQEAINQTYLKALEQEKIDFIGAPQINITKLAPLNPFSYKIRVALRPQIKLGDYTKLKSRKKRVQLDPNKVEEVLNNLRKLQAKEIVVNRPAQKGDKVDMDFNIYLDKVPIEGGASKHYPVIIGEGKLVPGFEEQLIGLKKGEEKTFTLKFPKNYFQKNLRGKETEVKVKINEVYEVKLPPLSDQFAQSISKFSTLAELKKQLAQNLQKEAENKEQQRFELALLEELINQSEFGEIAPLLIKQEAQKMVEEMKRDIESRGAKFEEYLQSIKKTKEELEEDFKEQAEKRIKSALILQKIAEREKITVTPEEVNKEIASLLRLYPQNPEIKKQTENSDFRKYIATLLTHRKVFRLLEKLSSQN
jgi:trigger factor